MSLYSARLVGIWHYEKEYADLIEWDNNNKGIIEWDFPSKIDENGGKVSPTYLYFKTEEDMTMCKLLFPYIISVM